MGRYVPAPQPHRKPGPSGKSRWKEGVTHYCGTCAGHGVVICPEYCIGGCRACYMVGEVACPTCLGGAIATAPPEWLPEPPETPQPPRCHHAETGENPGAAGAGRVDTEAS